jgi:signal recognition particle subunit SRP54
MGGMNRSATKKKPKGRKGKNGKRKPAKKGGGQQRMPQGMPGMPGMGGGMPGMGGGMPSMADLQKMQQQMPPRFENVDLDNLDFGKK